jgi:hypothetical protein
VQRIQTKGDKKDMSLTDGGMIRKTKKNQVLLAIIKFIEKTFVRFQQWLWNFVEIEQNE